MYNERLANKILEKLDEAFPKKIGLSDLQASLEEFKGFREEDWLTAIDALFKEGLVDGRPLRTGFDAALRAVVNLEINQRGRQEIRNRRALKRQQRSAVAPGAAESNVLFLSHAASDKDLAIYLKDVIHKCFPQLEVFVSSDPEDLPPGDPWVQTVLEKLAAARVLLLLATERGIGRRWVWFEMGAGWSRNLRIMPCCVGKVRKGQLPAPFSAYQAVNADEERDLQDLLEALAKEFSVSPRMPELPAVIKILNSLSQRAEEFTAAVLPPGQIQKRIDAVEVSASVEQGVSQNFLILVRNDSDEIVFIREVQLESRGVRLTEPARAQPADLWKIGARNRLSIGWRAQPDPAGSLLKMNPNVGLHFDTEMHVLLVYEVLGTIKKCDCKLWVQVEVPNMRIRQLAG